jgi:hypothetical protein
MGVLAQTAGVPANRVSWWEQYVLPPDPEVSSPVWHISPVIDVVAYHFSWVWILVPMTVASMLWRDPAYPGVDLNLYALVIGLNLAHRHFGLPYAYFDDEVFRAHRRQLTWFPLVCIVLLAATPALLDPESTGSIGAGAVTAIVFFSVIWNLWHVFMQKFGILRLYMAKDFAPANLKTAAWVDKYFVLCWFPLYLSYLAPIYKSTILSRGQVVASYTSVIIRFMEDYRAWLIAPSALVAAGGVGLWLWYDWRAHRFRNRARLSAAAGTLMISTALFWADPLKAFIAFGFSHAVEYMVFVWAFQRRRYLRPEAKPCLMQRLLRHPKSWYAVLIGLFGTIGVLQVLGGRTILTDAKPVALFDITLRGWILFYAAYQSLVHFYLDGFLWKMRRPEVRANI